MFAFAQARTNMVDSQLRPNGVTDARILDAMQNVRREDFVAEGQRAIAYVDGDVPLKMADTPRSLIDPMAFARMLQLVDINADDKVLEIGAATGYGAAVLVQIAKHVVAVEQDAGLYATAANNLNGMDKVSLIEGPLAEGCSRLAPFDVILMSGQVQSVPNALFSQLSDGGRLIAVVGARGMGRCCLWTKSGHTHTQRFVFDVSIASLPGFGTAQAEFAF